MSSSRTGWDRRAFLRRSGALVGAAAALPLVGRGAAWAADDVSLNFEGWNYDPAFQSEIVKEFVQANPNIKAEFVAQPAGQYVQKMIARFTAGNPPDLLYVRDQSLAGWADAGYIRPINEFPGWEKHVEGLIPFHLDGLQYEGKTWGLPYYGDHIAYIYNADILQKAGIAAPPSTWAEISEQALAIKKAGILDRPLVFPLKAGSGLHWWSAVYASGGHLFDAEGNPLFADKDPVSLQLLEYLVQANEKQILDPASVQMGTAEARLAFAAGKIAFSSAARYDLKLINDPKTSKIAGAAKQVLFPSLTASGPHATVGWTQMFSISADTKHPQEAWKLLQFISSQEVAKRYYLKNGVGYAYKSLDNDPDIAAETQKWSDQAMFAKQGSLAKPREYMTFPWAAEWEDFHIQQLQEAVLGRKSARDALQASASKAIQLKKA
ncbi:sugar ABC transporter substrate-binding protein [Alsobacter sp. SYSU M60028]|uniref:Sugar ABC transporter substrate-binding protein n=1 Tax=Alsobacter ponti TaxID=2962936 RepID=A0ABT1L8V8_9HYPH|nr:sugar ABC transporter substrate-binding protein [Alsobacter ponti]MCP8937468.1 sugar ABC transporter substrate-binding protein [Alsobacter ponti]